jgi:ribosomal protein L7Ae-like RNA K-turn-binding protein
LTEAGEDRAARLIALLGLARRAGKLAVGMSAVEQLVKRGEKPLVVVAIDAGPGTRARVGRWQPVRGVVAEAVTAADLAQALGRDKLSVVAVSDPGFVQGIGKLGF